MLTTILDIARMNGNDALVGLIDEAAKPHPEITMVPARTIKGLNYKTLVRTGVPTGGSFRNANEGTDAKKGTFEQRMVSTYIFEPRFECDKAVADRHEDGAAAYLAIEAAAIMEGAFQDLCTQFYYGTDGKGFPGLIHAVTSAMTVNAGGSTAKTSAWAIRFGPQHTNWVFGNDGSMDMADPRIETLTDDNGKKFKGYVQEMLAYPGLQVGSVFSVARIKNLSTDSGKGLTDALVDDLLECFPDGTAPDLIVLNKRSAKQLKQSRTATNPTGKPAEWVTGVEGLNGQIIPVRITGAITNAETA
ncbi:MAG: hypothetical protein BWX88_05009 [Planctomycetes bacterium ADurb.Bin126]|nr:MAG: hypothetical protein BWX88_05009 [Planctomycetes bacterium ADurb.Bin126]HOD84297.1 hypothetical protein [Phycisphaerae bacterium]